MATSATSDSQPGDRRRAYRIAVAAGVVPSIVGVVVYLLVPLRSTDTPHAMESTWIVFEHFGTLSLAYHAAVLVGTTFLVTVAAILIARWTGLSDLETDLPILGGVLGIPIATIWFAMIVAVLAIAVLDGPYLLPWVVFVGFFLTMFVSLLVLGGTLVGTFGGYATVRGLEFVWKRRT